MKQEIQHFDTSNYPPINRFGIPPCNKGILGIMKDECSSRIIKEFVTLKSKMYSFRMECSNDDNDDDDNDDDDDDEVKKSKGVKSYVVKRKITFDDYLHTLRNKTIVRKKQNLIKSRLHKLFTINQSKIVLSYNDDKRFLIPNSTSTLAHGHKNIKKIYNYIQNEL